MYTRVLQDWLNLVVVSFISSTDAGFRLVAPKFEHLDAFFALHNKSSSEFARFLLSKEKKIHFIEEPMRWYGRQRSEIRAIVFRTMAFGFLHNDEWHHYWFIGCPTLKEPRLLKRLCVWFSMSSTLNLSIRWGRPCWVEKSTSFIRTKLSRG